MTNTSNDILKTSPHFFNCGLHVIVPYLVAFISPESTQTEHFQFNEVKPSTKNQDAFKKTIGYQYFLEAFLFFYKLNDKPSQNKYTFKSVITLAAFKPAEKPEDIIRTLLKKFSHPLDLQVLLGPVLRLMLNKVLLHNTAHKAEIKASFNVILNHCLKQYAEFDHGFALQDEKYKIEWLKKKKIQWDRSIEHEEIFTPNIALIASIIGTQPETGLDQHWEKIYQNYCKYQSAPTKCINISRSQLAFLCQSFNFNFYHKQSNGELQTETECSLSSLAKVIVMNRTQDHWEIATTTENNWDYTQHSKDATFRSYHARGIELLSEGINSSQIKILQTLFITKVKQFLIDKIDFVENFFAIMPNHQWANNASLEGFANLIIKDVLEEPSMLQNTHGFKSFLSEFTKYYELSSGLNQGEILKSLKNLLLTYPSPLDRIKILTPILRKMVEPGRMTQRKIYLAEIKDLCRQFNIGLEIYANKQGSKISCFDKIDQVPNNSHKCDPLAITLINNHYFQVQKNPFIACTDSISYEYAENLQLLCQPITVPIDKYILSTQRGISDYLKNGILYIENPSARVIQQRIITLPNSLILEPLHDLAAHGTVSALDEEIKRHRVDINKLSISTGWTPLHFAVYCGNFQTAEYLLKLKAKWGVNGQWKLGQSDPQISTLPPKLTALDLAVCLDDRRMVARILKNAEESKDDALVQQAYEHACILKKTQLLHVFLAYKNIKHSEKALDNAIEAQDFVLVKAILLASPLLSTKLLTLSSLLKRILNEQQNSLGKKARLGRFVFLLNFAVLLETKKKSFNNQIFNIEATVLSLIELFVTSNSYKMLPSLLINIEKIAEEIYFKKDLPKFINENICKITTRVAQLACKAIKENKDDLFRKYLLASPKCIFLNGKHSPLHYALKMINIIKHKKYSLASSFQQNKNC